LATPLRWFLAAIFARRIGLVAMTLEIPICDLPEDPGKTAFNSRFLAQVGGPQKVLADLRAGRVGHLLDADHQNDAGRPRAEWT
jgi:hypothetical protein